MSLLGSYLKDLQIPTKRKVFISYHHRNDQAWFDYFTRKFSEQYDIFIGDNVAVNIHGYQAFCRPARF